MKAAKNDIRRRDVELLKFWPHERPFVVERIAHVFLQRTHIQGEWFSVSAVTAISAVEKTLAAVKTPRLMAVDWLGKAGMSEADAENYFKGMPGSDRVIPVARIFDEFIRRYWRNQYNRPGRKPVPKWFSKQGSENFYHQRMGLAHEIVDAEELSRDEAVKRIHDLDERVRRFAKDAADAEAQVRLALEEADRLRKLIQ